MGKPNPNAAGRQESLRITVSIPYNAACVTAALLLESLDSVRQTKSNGVTIVSVDRNYGSNCFPSEKHTGRTEIVVNAPIRPLVLGSYAHVLRITFVTLPLLQTSTTVIITTTTGSDILRRS